MIHKHFAAFIVLLGVVSLFFAGSSVARRASVPVIKIQQYAPVHDILGQGNQQCFDCIQRLAFILYSPGARAMAVASRLLDQGLELPVEIRQVISQ